MEEISERIRAAGSPEILDRSCRGIPQSLPRAAQARPMVKIAPLWVLMPPVARNISSSACIPRGRSAAKVSGAGLREEEAPAEKQRAK